MKTKILRFGLILAACLSLSLAAQAQDLKVPKDIKVVVPDLRVKSVKVEWLEIKGRGFYLQVTPTIQKNKTDKISTAADKPMIIFVGILYTGATPGPTCKLEVASWTSEETEKSFGTCTMKMHQYDNPTTGLVIVDDGNRIVELDEGNNNQSLGKIPPRPSN